MQRALLFLAIVVTRLTFGQEAQTASLPKSSEFPPTIMGTVMFWCLPGSERFVQGEMLNADGSKTLSGFYGNAPLVRTMEQEFADLKEAGIDALSLDFFPGMDVPGNLERFAEKAKLSGTGIRVLGMIEMNHGEKVWSPDVLKTVWEARSSNGALLREHPNLFTVGKDRIPAFITFGMEPADVWRQRLQSVRDAGGNAFVIGDTTSAEIATTTQVPERFKEPIAPLAGTFYFVSHTSGLRQDERGVLPDFMRFGRSFPDSKVVGAGVAPGYISSTRVGNLLSPRGTSFFRRQWLDIIEHRPDFIHLSMLSDYSENTEMECSANSTFTFLDLTRYFGSRWRNGRWPELNRPEAFLSYRKTLSPAQRATFELVILDPALAGSETEEQLSRRFDATLEIAFSNGEKERAICEKRSAFPGHAVLEFRAGRAWDGAQFAIPQVPAIAVNGRPLELPAANLAPVAIIGDGEEASRHWFHIPLHRVRALPEAGLAVMTAKGEDYPRKLQLSGIDWRATDAVVFERSPNPLSRALDSSEVESGWPEPYYVGPGFNPTLYQAGWSKRWVSDTQDRYLSVIRFKDGTIGYPRPTVVAAPRLKDATVTQDPVITPLNGHNRNELADRGPLQRALPFGSLNSATRPQIVPVDGAASWYALRFDGLRHQVGQGPFTFPSGNTTVELWVKPTTLGGEQAILSSQSACFNLTLMPGGKLVLERSNEQRQIVAVRGNIPLEIDRWNHIAAVQAGDQLRLYTNGHADGMVECIGARTDESTLLGGRIKYVEAQGAVTGQAASLPFSFRGDIARFRILSRAVNSEEIDHLFEHMMTSLGLNATTPKTVR